MIETRVAVLFHSQRSVSVRNAVAPSTLGLLVAAVLASCGADKRPDASAMAPDRALQACHDDGACDQDWQNTQPLRLDVCRHGRVILQERVRASAQSKHRPGDEQKTFVITPRESSVCVSLINGDEDAQHRAASAALYLGSRKLCESCVEHVTTLVEKAVAVDSGVPQALRVVVRGDGHDDFVEVVVREGGAIERVGLVHSRKGQAEIEAFNEHVPEAVSPFSAPVELRAEATLLRLADGPRRDDLSLRWQWEIQQAGPCRIVRRLGGESEATRPWTFAPTASFDGRGESGTALPSGDYGVRLSAWLVERHGHHHGEHERVLASVSSTVQRFQIYAEPPVITIVTPESMHWYRESIPVEVSFAHVDAASARVMLDGIDVTTELTVDASGARGVMPNQFADGDHELAVFGLGQDGSAQASTRTTFGTDTTPPVISLEQPAPEAIVTEPAVLVTGTVADLSPVELSVNGLPASLLDGAFSAGPFVLAPGANLITVTAVDAAGNASSATRVVASLAGFVAGGFVSAGGGRIAVTEGAARGSYVNIPAGAVIDPTLITLDLAAGDVPAPGIAVSAPLRIETSGALSGPATVALRYDEDAVRLAGSLDNLVTLYVLHTGASSWSLLSDSTVDLVTHVVSAGVSGFSTVQAFVEGQGSEAKLLGTVTPADLGVAAAATKSLAYGFDGSLHVLARGQVGSEQRASLTGVAADGSSRLHLESPSPLIARELVEVDNVAAPTRRPTEVTAIASGGRANATVLAQCDQASPGFPCLGTDCRCRLIVIREGQGE